MVELKEAMAPLAAMLRARAAKLAEEVEAETVQPTGIPESAVTDASDDAELLVVLARICEGQEPLEAFGAPGDWGYGTEIGDAVAAAHRARVEATTA